MKKPEEERTWADFEIGLSIYTQNFQENNISLFLDCYEDAMLMLQEYIELQMNETSEDIVSGQNKSFCEGLLHFANELSDAEKRSIQSMLPSHTNQNIAFRFISFNYTPILDRFVKVGAAQKLASWTFGSTTLHASIDANVLHVHGQLNNDPLMGVSDKRQIKNKALRENEELQQILVKPTASEALGELSQENAKNWIDNSNIICLWGLSIGESDSMWWESIMEWLGKSEANRLIVFWHTNGKVTKKLHTKVLQEKNAIREKLLGYSAYTREQMGSIKKKIYVVFDAQKTLRVSLKKKSKELAASTL